MTKKGRGWFGDHRRHVLAGKGVSTVLPDGRRLDVSKFVAAGMKHPFADKMSVKGSISLGKESDWFNSIPDEIIEEYIDAMAHRIESSFPYVDVKVSMGADINEDLEIEGVPMDNNIWLQDIFHHAEGGTAKEILDYYHTFGSFNNVNFILDMMDKESVVPNFASPNFVKDFADNRGISLDSKDVVYVSHMYGKVLEE